MRILLVMLLVASHAHAECERGGPLASAAREALRSGDFTPIAIWVMPAHEPELQATFRQAREVRVLGRAARELADCHFIDTAMRLHGAPSTDADALVELIVARLREQQQALRAKQRYRRGDVAAGRAYVASYTAFLRHVLALWNTAIEPPRSEARERHEE